VELWATSEALCVTKKTYTEFTKKHRATQRKRDISFLYSLAILTRK